MFRNRLQASIAGRVREVEQRPYGIGGRWIRLGPGSAGINLPSGCAGHGRIRRPVADPPTPSVEVSGSAKFPSLGRNIVAGYMAIPSGPFKRRFGGPNLSPNGEPAWTFPRSRVDDTLVKAPARAFGRLRLLETQLHGTWEEIARAAGSIPQMSIAFSASLCSPDIVAAILDGRQPFVRG